MSKGAVMFLVICPYGVIPLEDFCVTPSPVIRLNCGMGLPPTQELKYSGFCVSAKRATSVAYCMAFAGDGEDSKLVCAAPIRLPGTPYCGP